MLVKNIMTKKVVAIDPEMPIGDVYTLMEQRNIRHFPILEQSEGKSAKLVGIVSDRDIRTVGSDLSAQPEISLKDPVRRVMVQPVMTASPLDPVEESAKVLRTHKIGALPVVENDELVGIVTGIDFLDALVKMTGVEAASRLEIEVADRPNALADLIRAISVRGFSVYSVLTPQKDADSVSFVLRVNTIDGHGLARSLSEDGYNVLWPLPKNNL